MCWISLTCVVFLFISFFVTALRSEDSTPTAPVVSATAGADYSPIRYPIPYSYHHGGIYTYYIHIHINDDDEVEPTEEFQLNSENIGIATDSSYNDILACVGDCDIVIQIIDNDGAGESDGGGKVHHGGVQNYSDPLFFMKHYFLI